MLLLFLITTNTDTNRFEGDIATTVRKSLLGHHDQTVTTGNFHMNNGQTLDVALCDHRCELVNIRRRIIKLRAGNRQGLTLEKVFLEVSIGKRCTVGSKNNISTLEERSCRGHQMQLNRPLRQT